MGRIATSPLRTSAYLCATFDFVPLFGDPPERKGHVEILPIFGAPLILSPCLGTPKNAGVM